jgi:hypothetical protein
MIWVERLLFKDERELISKIISPYLKKNNNNVRIGVRLGSLYSKLKTENSLSNKELEIEHPLNPDIDILYWDKNYTGEPILNAVEVKYFRYDKSKMIRPSIYDGIGEAVLLCTYGVDYVHLWHFFDPEIPSNDFDKYKNTLESCMTVINIINYKCELISEPTEAASNTWKETYESLETLRFIIYNKNLKLNKLKYDEKAKTIRSLIKMGYRIINK